VKDLKEHLVNLLYQHNINKIYESWFRQERAERKRRLNFVMELSIELAKIKETTNFSTGLAELGIESVIEGDWTMVKEWADHFTFEEERSEIRLSHASVYARFSELLQQCWETRPGTSQAQA
jgi:type II secretory pathway component PulL